MDQGIADFVQTRDSESEPALRADRQLGTSRNARTLLLTPRWSRALPAVVVATYVVLGLIAYWPVFPGISHRLFGQTDDYLQSAWFIGWVPHAIAHGLNPFFTNAMFVPTGVNLAQNTASPLFGLIGAPLTEAFNPLVTTNVLMVLAMPVSATAAFVVLREWKVWLPGAALGGLVYGFSPYMVGQGTDHLYLTFAPLPPFIALTIVSILQRKGSPWRLGIQLGLLVVAQYLISQEVLVDIAIISFAALVCFALRYPRRIPAIALAIGRPLLVALPLVVALLAYPVWMLVAGPQHATVPRKSRCESLPQRSAQLFRSRTIAARFIWNAIARGPLDAGPENWVFADPH